jgi:hypothetical protein
MTSNPRCARSFTGSTSIGKKLMAQCAGTMKKIRWNSAATPPSSCSPMRTWMRRGGRHRQQVPQHGPDLRVRQPAAGAGTGV